MGKGENLTDAGAGRAFFAFVPKSRTHHRPAYGHNYVLHSCESITSAIVIVKNVIDKISTFTEVMNPLSYSCEFQREYRTELAVSSVN